MNAIRVILNQEVLNTVGCDTKEGVVGVLIEIRHKSRGSTNGSVQFHALDESKSGSKRFISWERKELVIGDELMIQLVSTQEFTNPSETREQTTADLEPLLREQYESLKKHFEHKTH